MTEKENPKFARISLRRSTYEKLKSLPGPGLSIREYLENVVDDLSAGHRPEDIKTGLPSEEPSLLTVLKEVRALNKTISELGERLEKLERKTATPAAEQPASNQESPQCGPETGSPDPEAERRQIEAQKDSPEYQDWLRRIYNGNGAVLYQKPVFEMDAAGNVIYEDGKPKVVKNQAYLYNLVATQLEKLREAWQIE